VQGAFWQKSLKLSNMSKIQLPPQRNNGDIKEKSISEKKIIDVINKGGSSIQEPDNPSPDVLKVFTIKIPKSDLEIISILCKKRPQRIGRKISFAKQDWFLDAVKEKIERERKKFDI
jgi:hypothetical protein